MLPRHDRDALGRTGLLAHVAGDTLERSVLARLQDVLAAEPVRVVALALGIQDRRHAPHVHEVAHHVPQRDGHPPHDLGQVEPLEQRELARGLPADVDDAAHRSSSPAMTFNVPRVAIMSDTVPPRMIFSKAAMFGKQGGRTFRR